jgi:hypothetical protein
VSSFLSFLSGKKYGKLIRKFKPFQSFWISTTISHCRSQGLKDFPSKSFILLEFGCIWFVYCE